jgi:hypothetical protein
MGRLGLTSDQPGQDKSRITLRTDRAGRTASLQRIGLASPRQDPCSPRHLAGAHPQGDDPVAPGRPLRGAAWHSQQQPAVVQLYSTCTAHVVAQQAAPRAAILAAAGYSFSTGYVQASATTVQLYSCTTVPYSYTFSDAQRQSDTAAAVGQYHHAWTGTEWDR